MRTAWNKGLKRPPFSEEWKKNMSIGHTGKPSGMKGKKHSLETRRKIGMFKFSAEQIRIRSEKQFRPLVEWKCKICKVIKIVRATKNNMKLKYCSYKCSGFSKRIPKRVCIDCGALTNGKLKTKRCVPCRSKIYIGEKSPGWKGGVSPINTRIRGSARYSKWRLGVFERDDFTCQLCGLRGVKLQADHIKPFAYFPELRFELSNGRTLCVNCHKKTDTYLHRCKQKYKEVA